jgi:hypothetical protein
MSSDGRGSLVWFSQASMFQSSELDSNSVKEAKRKGHSGKTDFKADAEAAYTKFANFKRIKY